jgi:putative membrane protein
VRPFDFFTWFLEVLPIFIGLPIALATQRRFPLSSLLLLLLWWHSVILIVGGHYSYARVPLGDWAMQAFGWERNNYDKVGHFAQGFVPAIFFREMLLRTSPLRGSRWMGLLCVSMCLAFSALYELLEWWVAVASGAAAEDFLGTQGYAWDTQSDMAWALGGALAALLLLSRAHDRSLARIATQSR